LIKPTTLRLWTRSDKFFRDETVKYLTHECPARLQVGTVD